eukprot:m.49675 g.49675  ORF g.49675 m.49675 type:complete len:348 (-) comp17943_c0_seq1:178-1221(-)
MSLQKFIDSYKKRDQYLVYDLSPRMKRDMKLLPFMHCGGFTDVLTKVVTWFSSGGTKSVLHNDGSENINCLIDGKKRFLIFDKKYRDIVESNGTGWNPEGGYARLDVDAVDLLKYPAIAEMDYLIGDMEAGDCMYLPYFHYHQVNSWDRNLACNVWFQPFDFNETDCEHVDPEAHKNLNQYEFHDPEDSISSLIGMLVETAHKSKVLISDIVDRFGEPGHTQELESTLADADNNADGYLSMKEAAEHLLTDDYTGRSPLLAGRLNRVVVKSDVLHGFVASQRDLNDPDGVHDDDEEDEDEGPDDEDDDDEDDEDEEDEDREGEQEGTGEERFERPFTHNALPSLSFI